MPGFSNYKIQAELGRGGMGIVYKAVDSRDNKIVAIKQLILENVDPEKHEEFTERFRREAKTASMLKHENIVNVLDISEEGSEKLFYVMEYLEGRSLREELARHKNGMSAHKFWNILKQVADGLSYAHSLNVVHRDIKPDNIFILNDGRVVITDFGIARIADLEATNITKTGVMLGTLAYVSPEQLQNAKKVDHRADIFSLGVVSYEALAGDLPFTGDGIAATIVKIMSHDEIPLHIKRKGICDNLSATVGKSLRKHPKDRFRSVKEFLRDYQEALKVQPITEDEDFGFDPDSTSVDVPISKNLLTTSSEPMGDFMEGEGTELDKDFSELKQASIDETVQSTNLSNFAREISETKKARSPVQMTGTRRRLGGRSQAETTESKELGARLSKSSISSAYNPIKPHLIIDRIEKEETFLEPAVISYRSGRIVVADIAKRSAYILSSDGRFISRIAPRPEFSNSQTGGGLLTKPSGIDIDEKGRIYICDSADHFIRIFDNQGNFLKEFKNIKGESGGLQGIAIDSTGLIYVSDSGNGTLEVFQSDVGVWVREISRQEGAGLQLPAGIACDRLNKVYVVDYGTSQVSVFNKSGALIRSFGSKGRGNGMFNVPRACAVDKHDRIFVLDSLNHRIQVFASSGDWVYTYGGIGKEPGLFLGPSDLSIDKDNNLLFVADKGNKRIQVLELSFK